MKTFTESCCFVVSFFVSWVQRWEGMCKHLQLGVHGEAARKGEGKEEGMGGGCNAAVKGKERSRFKLRTGG